jgi:hypothetical protein
LAGAGGLSLNEVRDALRVFVSQPNLGALVVAGYNPDLDTDGQGARKLIDFLADVLVTRLETTSAATAGATESAAASSAPGPSTSENAAAAPSAAASTDVEPDRAAPADLPEGTEPDTNVS